MPSASLVPAGDQTLLFTNSGMVQFKDVFTGVEKRSYTRAVDFQRCLRVAGKHNDFEEVGRTTRHHTLFEMLGNWSFGDYFKREAIHWAWEFLTDDLGIPPERLAATTYKDDELARAVWRDEIGLTAERMARWGDVDAGDDNNFWRMADTGPCGPCSEIHYDRGAELSEGPECIPDHSEHCPRWLEIWNLVFMEFDQHPDGRVPLPFPSVDTGMGLERLASVLQGVPNNYDTDLFTPIHARMRELLGHDPDAFESERFSYQVIADHARAMTFLVADGVLPSNEGRGYVLRSSSAAPCATVGCWVARSRSWRAGEVVIALMGDAYPVVVERAPTSWPSCREEAQFARTLDAGTRHFEEPFPMPCPARDAAVGRRPEDLPPTAPSLPGEVAFRLHDTYGFPIDLTVELAAEYGVRVDRAGFEAALRGPARALPLGHEARPRPRRPSWALALQALRASPRGDGPFRATRPPRRRARVVAIVRDGTEYEELEAAPTSSCARAAAEAHRARPDAVLRGGWRPGRRPRCAARAGGGSLLFTVDDTQRPVGGPADRPPRQGCTAAWPSAGRSGRGGRRPPRPHDAQPHRHAPPAPRAAQHGRRGGPPGRLAGDARLPALRLPLRPGA